LKVTLQPKTSWTCQPWKHSPPWPAIVSAPRFEPLSAVGRRVEHTSRWSRKIASLRKSWSVRPGSSGGRCCKTPRVGHTVTTPQPGLRAQERAGKLVSYFGGFFKTNAHLLRSSRRSSLAFGRRWTNRHHGWMPPSRRSRVEPRLFPPLRSMAPCSIRRFGRHPCEARTWLASSR